MTKTADQMFKELAEHGEKALGVMHESAYSPDQKKILRNWGITEISALVGRTANYIRQQEQASVIPQPSIDPTTKRRIYTLEHINRLRDHFNTRPSCHKPQDTAVIAYANFKGGAAKTTSAVNSAQYFAKQGYKVLLIDCDSQASATQIFGYVPDQDIDGDETMLPFLLGEINSLRDVIRKTHWHGLDLIPANLELYGAEFALPVKSARAGLEGKKFEFYSLLANGLEEIKSDYDIIILDCPPSMGIISINAIFAANSLIIPAPPAMLDFTSTVQFFYMLYETLERLPKKIYRFIRIMVTKHDGRATSDTIVNILRQVYGKYVLLNIMYSSEVIKKASASMQTIYEIDRYEGSKKSFDRALFYTDAVHNEIENIVQTTWAGKNSSHSTAEREEEVL